MTEKKKAWVVIANLSIAELEDKLNELAADSYQAFRIDLTPENGFVVVAFDPSQIAERQSRALAETVAKLAGLPMMTPPGVAAPSSG